MARTVVRLTADEQGMATWLDYTLTLGGHPVPMDRVGALCATTTEGYMIGHLAVRCIVRDRRARLGAVVA